MLRLLTNAERPLILAGAGVLRARTSTDLTRFAELLRSRSSRRRRGDVISNENRSISAWRVSAPRGRPRADRGSGCAPGPGLPPVGDDQLRLPRPGGGQPLGPRRHRSAGAAGPARSGTVDRQRCTSVPARIDRPPPQPCGPRRRVGRRAASPERGRPRSLGSGDGRRRRRVGRTGRPPGRTIATLRRVLPDDAIVTSDAGNFAGWLNRGFRFRKPGTFLGPTSGAMGYGLPAAIAAALVHRDRPAVALVGDGGLGMTLAELETAVRERARVIVIVFDNQRYGTIRMWQERRGSGQGVATELGPVDFAAIARACGARGALVERDDEFEPASGRHSSPSGRRSSRSRSTRRGSRWATGPSAEETVSRRAARRPRTTAERGRARRAARRRGRPTSRRDVRRAVRAEPGADERGDDLPDRPGPGELPALLGVRDRQPVDVLGRPSA